MTEAKDARSNSDLQDDKKHNGNSSPEQLEREVDQARARFGKTANELSDRLSPGELVDQAFGMVREHGGEFGRNLGSQVKNNPMPMILTSVGLSWMMMSSGKNGTAGSHDTKSTSADKDGSSVKDALGNTLAKSRDKAAAVGDSMQGGTANLKESAQNARESLAQFYRDQPLLAGSLGIAIGAALGALIPPTEIEDDNLGEARDHTVEAAESKAAQKYDELRESARPQ